MRRTCWKPVSQADQTIHLPEAGSQRGCSGRAGQQSVSLTASYCALYLCVVYISSPTFQAHVQEAGELGWPDHPSSSRLSEGVLREGRPTILSCLSQFHILPCNLALCISPPQPFRRMCWKLVSQAGQTAIFQKQADAGCVADLSEASKPPLCEADQDADAAWYFPMQACISRNTRGQLLWPLYCLIPLNCLLPFMCPHTPHLSLSPHFPPLIACVMATFGVGTFVAARLAQPPPPSLT